MSHLHLHLQALRHSGGTQASQSMLRVFDGGGGGGGGWGRVVVIYFLQKHFSGSAIERRK